MTKASNEELTRFVELCVHILAYRSQQPLNPSNLTIGDEIEDSKENGTDNGQFDQALNNKHHNYPSFFRSLLLQKKFRYRRKALVTLIDCFIKRFIPLLAARLNRNLNARYVIEHFNCKHENLVMRANVSLTISAQQILHFISII